MNESEIWPKLTETFREVFDDESLEIAPETTAQDVPEWDSLTHIELLVAVERAFKVRFNMGEVVNLPNVGSMVQLLAQKTGA